MAGGDATGIVAERLAVRRRLIDALLEATRTLLLRASIIFGRYRRELVLALGEIEPSVRLPGEHLDRLLGS